MDFFLMRRLVPSSLMSPKQKTLGSPLDCKEIQPVRPKGNQS